MQANGPLAPHLQKPFNGGEMPIAMGRFERPGNRLANRPPAGAVTIEAQLGGQAIKTTCCISAGVTQLEGPNDRSNRKLTLSR